MLKHSRLLFMDRCCNTKDRGRGFCWIDWIGSKGLSWGDFLAGLCCLCCS
ncbi:unnamed protein product [Prunus brigantina]